MLGCVPVVAAVVLAAAVGVTDADRGAEVVTTPGEDAADVTTVGATDGRVVTACVTDADCGAEVVTTVGATDG